MTLDLFTYMCLEVKEGTMHDGCRTKPEFSNLTMGAQTSSTPRGTSRHRTSDTSDTVGRWGA